MSFWKERFTDWELSGIIFIVSIFVIGIIAGYFRG